MELSWKISVKIRVPEDLIALTRQLLLLIDSGGIEAMEKGATLAQCDNAYSWHNSDVDKYCIKYFPADDTVTKWRFDFSLSELREIMKDATKEFVLWRCPEPDCPNLHSNAYENCDYCEFWQRQNLIRPGIEQEARCHSREEWLDLFFRFNPKATRLQIHQAFYQNTPGLARLRR